LSISFRNSAHWNASKCNFTRIKERQAGTFLEWIFSGNFTYFIFVLLILFSLFQRAICCFFTIYCFSYSIFFLSADGYLYQIDWINNLPVILDILGLNLVNFSIVFELLFIQKYLTLKTRLPFWNKIFSGVIYLGVITIFSVTILFLWTKKFDASVGLISLFQIFSSSKQY
jgi:hypothetical protein